MFTALTAVTGKLSDATESVTIGAGTTPDPLRVTDCGEPVALSATPSDAVSAPPAAGLKVTVTVHDALAASDVPQLLVCEKEVAFEPPMVMPERVNAAVPVFLSVIPCVAEEELTMVEANARLVGERETAGALPVPLRVTACGELVALSAKLSEAESAPAAEGLKVTETVHDALIASDAPQVVVSVKEVAFVPVMIMPERVSAAVPVLVSVTVCAAAEAPVLVAAKVRLAAERVTVGAVPVPLRATACGELAALSAKLSEAESDPLAEGLKVTETMQELLAASDAPQVVVSVKEVAFVPMMAMPERTTAAVPVLVSVTFCVAEDAPTAVEAKARLAVERLIVGVAPVPLRATVCGVLAALSAKLSVAESAPVAVGLKVTVTVQEPPALIVPQLLF